MRSIYMDYSATTPTKQEVIDTMLPYFNENYGNASSLHMVGQRAKEALNSARQTIANTLGVKPEEIYFTSGGTESDNWAIKGVARAYAKKGKHIITSAIEHHAVLHTCQALEKEGFEVTYLPVDQLGFINLDELKNSIRKDTTLVTIMTINNEIGTRQDIEAIGKICKEAGVLFHTDAVQAYGNMVLKPKEMNIDLMSFSGHKIYGPKGIGALYIRSGMKIDVFLDGGAQERKRRAGTENIPAIMGFAKAAQLAYDNLDQHIAKLTTIRDQIIDRVLAEVPDSRVNGDREKRHPGNIHLCFKYIEGEALLLSMDAKGIQGSSGSACTSGSLDPSHVLLAIGLSHEIAHGSLRLTVGDFTEDDCVDYVVQSIKEVVEKLRQWSPLYHERVKVE